MRQTWRRRSPTALGLDVERYSGVQPVAGEARIASRHSLHPDNAAAVDALVGDLKQRGAGPPLRR